jgi:two-component system sensor histidine kinase YesM
MKSLALNQIGIRSKLVVTYIILITLPLGIFGIRYFIASKNVVSDIAQKNVYEMVVKNNQLIDTKLSLVLESILSFTVDKDLYNTFSTVKPDSDYHIMLLDKQITDIMNKYFSHSQDIFSSQLATSYFTYGPSSSLTGKSFIPAEGFTNTELYQLAVEHKGRTQWVPTYDFAEMFKLDYMKNVNIDYRYMFSAVQLIQGAYFDGTTFHSFADHIEKPVLIVNFKENFFRNVFNNSIPVKGGYYFLISKDGRIVSHQDQSQVAHKIVLPGIEELFTKKSGITRMKIDGKNMIVCYDTSKVTGWLSVVVIPPENMLGEIPQTMISNLLYTALFLVPVFIFIYYFITGRITRPLQKLMRAIKKTGEGKFDVSIVEQGSGEVRVLIQKFNNMNSRIQKLIEENYEIQIKEKEAEITALNLQLDPHFMYNTLNLINLISIENGQDEISEMIVSLSNMLKYKVKSNKELVIFKHDLEYLEGYVSIMTKRFEGKFRVEYDIDPGLFPYGVPKFFLQPFVENAFVHAFQSMKKEGVLRIIGRKEPSGGFFIIEDNGIGMNEETLSKITDTDKSSVGIRNVKERIRILFGKDYGVTIHSALGQGTKVVINLPSEYKENHIFGSS